MTNNNKPPAWLRCNICFGTGYMFSPIVPPEPGGPTATMTKASCTKCKGKGQTVLEIKECSHFWRMWHDTQTAECIYCGEKWKSKPLMREEFEP